MVQAQARVLGLGLGLGLGLVQGQVQLLPQDQVLGQAHPVLDQKQVHMQGLEPGQDQEATKEVDQALVLDTERVLEEEVGLVKVMVMVKAVAMAQGEGVGMENEVTSFSLGLKRK